MLARRARWIVWRTLRPGRIAAALLDAWLDRLVEQAMRLHCQQARSRDEVADIPARGTHSCELRPCFQRNRFSPPHLVIHDATLRDILQGVGRPSLISDEASFVPEIRSTLPSLSNDGDGQTRRSGYPAGLSPGPDGQLPPTNWDGRRENRKWIAFATSKHDPGSQMRSAPCLVATGVAGSLSGTLARSEGELAFQSLVTHL